MHKCRCGMSSYRGKAQTGRERPDKTRAILAKVKYATISVLTGKRVCRSRLPSLHALVLG